MDDKTKNNDNKNMGCIGYLILALVALVVIAFWVLMNSGPKMIYDDLDRPGVRGRLR